MATKIVEVASFDIETDKAVRSINQYIDGLKRLEKQRKDNIKLGKSTVSINNKIDKSIEEINKSLKQETATTKGQVAQLEAVRKVQKDISRDGQKRIKLLDTEVKKRKAISRSLRSQRRAFGELKFLAVGAAVGIVAALGQVGQAVDAVNDVLFPSIGLQNRVAEATKSSTLEYIKEKAALDNKFEAVNAATVGTAEHTEAVKSIVESYGPYLSDLAKEELALGRSVLAQEEATKAIIRRITAQTKLAIAEKLIQQIIDSRIDSVTRAAQANAGAGQVLEDLVQGPIFALAEATGLFDASEAVAGLGNELDKLKSESAVKQLDLLATTGDDVFASFFKSFDGLAEILQPFEEGIEDAEKGTGKTGKAVKDLSGTLAGLSKQLTDAKKILTEGIQIIDEQALQEQQGIINTLEKRIKDLQEFLKSVGDEPIPIGELEFFKPDLDTLFALDPAKVQASLQKGLDLLSISGLRAKVEQVEIQGLLDVEAIEKERNAALKIFRGTADQRDELNKEFSAKRLNREQQTTRSILSLQLRILQAERKIAATAGDSVVAFDKAIASLNLQLTELDRQDVDVKINADTEDAESKIEKVKDTIGFVIDGIEQLGGAIIQFFQQQTDAAITKLEGDIERQRSFLDELLSNQEGANAAQVELERDRLDNLVEEREKAVEKQAAIAQLEIALNAAIAIARAAAEGGAGAAITIAATLIALAVGFATAKATASQAFAGGTDFVTRAKGEPSGTDTVSARLDEGEAVIQKGMNKRYHSAVKAIRKGNIDANLMHDFVTNPEKYKDFAMDQSNGMLMPSLQQRMDTSGITLNAAGGGMSQGDIALMVNEMKAMREMMGQISVSEWNVKGKQFAKVVTSVQDKHKRNGLRFR